MPRRGFWANLLCGMKRHPGRIVGSPPVFGQDKVKLAWIIGSKISDSFHDVHTFQVRAVGRYVAKVYLTFLLHSFVYAKTSNS